MIARTVLITGCSTGIGRACAERLSRAGHTVYATARRIESIEDLRAAGCRILALDVTDEASMRAAVEAVEAEQGAVGALVNNAGYSQSGAIETVSMEDLRRQFETNVFGLTRMCQLVLPGMRAKGDGRIVNMSSMGGNFTFPGGGAYHATKYAVEAISDALRFEVKGFGVGVTVIQPGAIRTEFAATAVGAIAEDDGPYATFNAEVARATRESYEKGPLARLGGGEGHHRAARAHPHARDAVGAPARHPAPADARSGMGRVPGHAVPASRSLSSELDEAPNRG
jgi:NAD(P)-dependent dehydrogenase (short-subunit alcohol dehydrogenase family)